MKINETLTQELYEEAGESRIEKARRYLRQGRVDIKKVIYDNPDNFEISAEIEGIYDFYHTRIKVEDGELEDLSCECQDYYNRYAACKHIVATLMKFSQTNYWDKDYIEEDVSKRNNKFSNFRKVVKDLYNESIVELETENEVQTSLEEKIKIEPKIVVNRFDEKLRLEFKVGNKRMYKIKDLEEFYTRVEKEENYKYGDKLEFIHKKENFVDSDQNLLEFILRYSEVLKNAENANRYTYYGNTLNKTSITLGENSLDEIFDILKNKKVLLDRERVVSPLELIEGNPNIEFELTQTGEDFNIHPNIEIFKIQIYQGKKYTYILEDNSLYRCSKDFADTTIKLLRIFKENYVMDLELGQEDLKDLYSVVMPRVGDCIKLKNIEEKNFEQYKPKNLGVKIFLDFDENDYIIADVKFCYGDEEFNPLEKNIDIKNARNTLEENKSLNILRKTGFMVDTYNLRFILPQEDRIYNFLANDIELYMQKFEVLATEKFKTKEIKRPKIGTIGVKIENDLLSIDLSKIDINTQELKEIMQKYQLKKKYHRLKDGSFINLEENEDIEFLDKLVSGMDLEYKDLEKENIKLPVSRSLYLNTLLKNENNIKVAKNNEFKKVVNDLQQDNINDEIEIPTQMEKILRDYQKTGYKWLKVLDSYHFGGILADDMGLGKTLQILTMLLEYKKSSESTEFNNGTETDIEGSESTEFNNGAETNIETSESTEFNNGAETNIEASESTEFNNGTETNIENYKNKENKKTSIVVCPSSLTLNWLSEAKKFVPDLNVAVIKGNAVERQKLISEIERFDLIITSYDLLKRDIKTYREKNYNFKYIIADEAQYMKNSTTQNAKAIKELNGETRFALTGTPIENSLSELWSIFDFVMPGYLFTYHKFKELYETPIVKENEEKAMKKLKMLIAPFILRRNKKDVLTELPEKTITVLNNQMTEEQEKIYLSYLMQAKEEVANEISINGFEKSQFKILATLTRLRQICCHPSLFIKDYKDESSKLKQCMEVLIDAIEAGHKILLFSGYTSMFEIIEKELQNKNIKYFKLTGSTKVDERIRLVDEFNSNPDIKVFLISLKAGGTGLNLTGADMVIHYDPWWNQSAENQATDRAYRIGQKNNVQVYKLITSNSIEEKIYELQNKKAALIDSMLDTKTSFINKLSKEEIMQLFE